MNIIVYDLYLYVKMDKKYISELIMSSYILSIDKKLTLISAIERGAISENNINEIVNVLKTAKDEIEWKTEEILNRTKRNYYKLLEKNINDAKLKLQKINLEADELLVNEKEWDPDNLLNQI